jgi:hypothetical protein
MKARSRRRFSSALLKALDENKMLGIQAGVDDHRFLGIWVVVVNQRAFIRSWNDKSTGWHRTFLDEPRGAIQIAGREVRVSAKKARGERLMAAIDRAYAEKYNTPGSRKYVRGLASPRRRATTMELVPR